jgi:hypothetical protein
MLFNNMGPSFISQPDGNSVFGNDSIYRVPLTTYTTQRLSISWYFSLGLCVLMVHPSSVICHLSSVIRHLSSVICFHHPLPKITFHILSAALPSQSGGTT